MKNEKLVKLEKGEEKIFKKVRNCRNLKIQNC